MAAVAVLVLAVAACAVVLRGFLLLINRATTNGKPANGRGGTGSV